MGFRSFFREWRELSRFRALDPESKSIVFYAEDGASWTYYKAMIDELTRKMGKRICYVTSSSDDPVLLRDDDSISAFYIGFGSARTIFFLSLRAGAMVMTMPDLNTFHIKRSIYPVHYVHVFHSLVSTHMAGRRDSLDHFDSILCVGPHHVEEIRANEALYGLKPKVLVEAGYGLLDSILGSVGGMNIGSTPAGASKRVLVAPSWGEQALLESHGPELVEVLLTAGHRVTVRPHPMTVAHHPKLVAQLSERFAARENFELDLNFTSQGAVNSSDLMISDWSGAALEYAFGLERPVLFIDVPRKVLNRDYEKLNCVPIEVQLRTEIGVVVSPERLKDLPEVIDNLCSSPFAWSSRIRELRSRWVYNISGSAPISAGYIARVAEAAATAAGG